MCLQTGTYVLPMLLLQQESHRSRFVILHNCSSHWKQWHTAHWNLWQEQQFVIFHITPKVEVVSRQTQQHGTNRSSDHCWSLWLLSFLSGLVGGGEISVHPSSEEPLSAASSAGIWIPEEMCSLTDFYGNSRVSDRLGAEIKTQQTLRDIDTWLNYKINLKGASWLGHRVGITRRKSLVLGTWLRTKMLAFWFACHAFMSPDDM